jgi:uncharacterized protein YegL
MSLDQLEQVEFAENPEPRCPVVLLLDTSGSMSGAAISELNAGLQEFSREVKADALASLRIEIAIVTFGGSVTVAQPFTAMHAFNSPTLTTRGGTPMGQAVRDGLQMIRDRKDTYKQNAIDYYRPWIFLITDGEPTDAGWETAAQEARDEEDNKRVLFFAVGVEGANMQTLARFSDKRAPVRLKGLAFRELFQWLSKSMSTVSRSRMGDTVELPPPSGWAQIPT